MTQQLDMNRIPQHIAIIMDGNGRWAAERGKPRSFGHQAGVDAVRKITSECTRLGVKYLTLYTFSTENWNRPATEVAALMGLVLTSLEDEIFMKNKEIMIVEPFPHVIETLRELHQRGFVLGVASSRNHCSLDGYVRQMALENIFTSIVAGDDVEHVKPAPNMVWRALKEMNGEIEEALVVGDMTFDVDMAHNAGCKACAVTYGNGTREQLASADWIIDDFAELLQKLDFLRS